MAETRTVKVVVTAAAEQYLSKMREVGTSADTAAKRAEQAFAKQKISLDQVGRAAAVTSAAFTVAFVAMVKASADFEQRMSQVQALSKATAAQMNSLRTAAFTAGKAFGLSATQVADAQIELTKAGVSVKDIIGGALPGALALAAAGQIDVAKATEIASNAMTQFGLAGKDVPHLADLLAAGADKSVASVESLGDALNQSGLVASQFGLTAEDTIGVLTAFSKAGLNGSDAGTSFKTMLLSLASPSKQAQKYLDEYNITAYDSQGAFVGITNLADQLQNKLGKVSQAQRNAALSTIFGTDAIRAANVLYTDGGKKLQGFIDGNNEAGFAALQASKKLDNLNGDIQKLGATFQNDLIKSGSAANDGLRGLAQAAGGVLSTFGDLPKPLQAVALEVAGVGAAVTGVGAALLLLGPKVLAGKKALQDLGVTGKSLVGTFGKGAALAIGLQALGGGIANLGAQGEVNAQQLDQAAKRIRGSYKNIDKVFPNAGGILGPLGANGADASLEILDGFLGKTNQLAANFTDGATAAITFGQAGTHLGDVFKSNRETFVATGTALAGLAQQDYPKAAASFNRFVDQLGGGTDKAQKLIRNLGPDYNKTLGDLATQAGVAATSTNKLSIATGKGLAADALRIAQAGAERTSQSLQEMSGSALKAGVDISAASKAIAGFGSVSLDARSAQRAFEQAVNDASDAVKKNGRTANKHKTDLDISTQAGRDNQAALDGIASSAAQASAKILEQSGSQAKAAAAIRKGRTAFIDAAVSMGIERAAAGKLADKLNLIPSKVATAVTLTGANAALSAMDDVYAKLGALNGRTARVAVQYTQTGKMPATGGAQFGFAAGGQITGPGPKGKDSVLAYLAPGEHVLTAKEVDKMGGQSAVYAFRKGIQAYAAGGAIGDATTAAARAAAQEAAYQRSVAAQKKQADAAQKAADRAQKRYEDIDGGKKNAAAKKTAKAAADRAKDAADKAAKKVDDLRDKRDKAKDAIQKANDTAASLRENREDFVSTQRRATPDNPIDPLSYVDQLRSMSRDDNFSTKRQKSYQNAANAYEKSLVTLAAQSDKAAKKLDELQSSADSMRSGIVSAITGQYSTGGIGMNTATTASSMMRNGIQFTTSGTASGTTADAIDNYYSVGATRSGQFAAQLQQLAKRGINGAFLAEIAQDPNGAQLATALLSATTGQIASINNGYASIQSNAGAAAGTVTDYNFAALISDAQANADKITAQIAADGDKLRKLIAGAFGLSGYATGTDYAAPGWHLVGEKGPELANFRGGGGAVKNNRWLTTAMAANGGSGGGNVTVTGPQNITILDADGRLMGTFATIANRTARQVVAQDAHLDSVLTIGGPA